MGNLSDTDDLGDLIRSEHHAGVCEIVINRPKTKNAILVEMYTALSEAFMAAEKEDTVRVVLLRGEGGSFSSGNDLKDFVENMPTGPESPVFRFMHVIAACKKPIIAAVQGFAVGIGSTMLLHCDVVYADPKTKFLLPFVNLALCPEAGSSVAMTRIGGLRKSSEALLFGEVFGAETAMELGLVSAVPEGDVVEHAQKRAALLAQKPSRAVRVTKQLLKQGIDAPTINAAIDREAMVFCELLKTPEVNEAITAFLEKRKPDFSPFY